jgi:hypothetical protein
MANKLNQNSTKLWKLEEALNELEIIHKKKV